MKNFKQGMPYSDLKFFKDHSNMEGEMSGGYWRSLGGKIGCLDQSGSNGDGKKQTYLGYVIVGKHKVINDRLYVSV